MPDSGNIITANSFCVVTANLIKMIQDSDDMEQLTKLELLEALEVVNAVALRWRTETGNPPSPPKLV